VSRTLQFGYLKISMTGSEAKVHELFLLLEAIQIILISWVPILLSFSTLSSGWTNCLGPFGLRPKSLEIQIILISWVSILLSFCTLFPRVGLIF
jgi:hypothetical protein